MSTSDEMTTREMSLKLCVLCAKDLTDKSPKLLPCLHTLCEGCHNTLFHIQKKIKEKTNKDSRSTQNTEEDKESENALNLNGENEKSGSDGLANANGSGDAKDGQTESGLGYSIFFLQKKWLDTIFVNTANVW